MFIDASALTAIVSSECEADAFLLRIEDSPVRPSTSAIALYESTLAVARRRRCSVPDAVDLIDMFLRAYGVSVVPIDAEISSRALEAQARYGKGTGHAAKLNMGDCFAYACAKAHGVALLYKGDDFVHTDLA